jgi:hypothetical protein
MGSGVRGKAPTDSALVGSLERTVGQLVRFSRPREDPNLPQSAAVPAVKPHDFAMLQNQVLIVNPSSKKIVDILSQ